MDHQTFPFYLQEFYNQTNLGVKVEVINAGRRLRVSSPVTREVVGEIDVQTAQDVSAALEIARKAQPGWAALSFEERARYLTRALQVMLDRYEEFIDVVVRETGKTRLEALYMEIFASCDVLQYYAKRTAKILRDRPQRMHLLSLMKKLRIVYRFRKRLPILAAVV